LELLECLGKVYNVRRLDIAVRRCVFLFFVVVDVVRV
jgi:hypothetical protein